MRADVKKDMAKHKRNKIIIIVLVIVLIGSAAAFAYFKLSNKDTNKESKPEEKPAVSQGEVNPLTGLECKDHIVRPVMVSTDNDSYLSRPQSGVADADLVYEVPIEGGGSRLEMVFYSKLPDKMGPARSARPYIVDLARGLDAIFVHNGWSPQAKEYLSTGVVDNIAAAAHWECFYRTDDRNSPHNCYADGEKLIDVAKKLGFWEEVEVKPYLFLKEGDKVEGKDINTIDINYVGTKNQYQYDKEKQKYLRFTGGEKFTDLEEKNQIEVSNIIVQKVDISVMDAQERLKIDLTKGGEGTLFTKGKMIPITWERDSLDNRTVFKDKSGKEVKLNPGKTYIQMIDYTVKVSYK